MKEEDEVISRTEMSHPLSLVGLDIDHLAKRLHASTEAVENLIQALIEQRAVLQEQSKSLRAIVSNNNQ